MLSDKEVLATRRTDLKSTPGAKAWSSAFCPLSTDTKTSTHHLPLHSALLPAGVSVAKNKAFLMMAFKKSATDHITSTALPEKSVEVQTRQDKATITFKIWAKEYTVCARHYLLQRQSMVWSAWREGRDFHKCWTHVTSLGVTVTKARRNRAGAIGFCSQRNKIASCFSPRKMLRRRHWVSSTAAGRGKKEWQTELPMVGRAALTICVGSEQAGRRQRKVPATLKPWRGASDICLTASRLIPNSAPLHWPRMPACFRERGRLAG